MKAMRALTDETPDTLTGAIVDNLIELFPVYAPMMPGGERVSVGESAAFFTDVQFPLFNGIVRPRFERPAPMRISTFWSTSPVLEAFPCCGG